LIVFDIKYASINISHKQIKDTDALKKVSMLFISFTSSTNVERAELSLMATE